MYIADGDYIKDIEVNDLRNRYTLTKGATQKMVKLVPPQVPGWTFVTTNQPFPKSTPPPYVLFCYTHVAFIQLFSGIVWRLNTAQSLELHKQLRVLPLTLHPCYLDQGRNWRRYALISSLNLNVRTRFAHAVGFQDVTTRGAYYPDKSMATPAVCFPTFWMRD